MAKDLEKVVSNQRDLIESLFCIACSNGKEHDFKLFEESRVRWTSHRY
jgi:hypothetical protein